MFKTFTTSVIIFICAATAAHNLLSQNQDTTAVPVDSVNYEMKPMYGVFGHFNYNLHTADFRALPGVPSCCPQFESGTGVSSSFGILMDYPIDEKWVLNFRLGYAFYNGVMKRTETQNLIKNGQSVDGTFEHKLDAVIGSIGFEPMASYNFYDNFYASAGFRVGLITNTNYSQIELIQSPDGATFKNGNYYENATSGAIPNAASLIAGFNLGFSAKYPLNKDKSLFLFPELYYTYNFTPVVTGVSWNIQSIHAGIAVKYRQPPPPPAPPPPPPPPPFPDVPLPEAPPAVTASVKAVEVDSTGAETENFNIRIEDFVSHNMRPLLNYIFFDSLSSTLPARYKLLKQSETEKFNIKTLREKNALETYYDVLNIMGQRLRDNPGARIKVIGANCNNGGEKNNLDLSKARAATVATYLTNVWNISPDRMTVEGRNLPEKPTRSDEPGGDEENRRVEIIADDASIIEPVLTIDTMRVISTATVRFLPKADSKAGIKNWEFKALLDGKTIKSESGTGYPPKNFDWHISNDDENAPKGSGNVFYNMKVTDSLGSTISTQNYRLPVEQLTIDRKRLERRADKEFEYYSLILFDFGKTELRSEHRKVVDFIKERITPNANVYILGYTDSIGDPKINEKISDKRAHAVFDRLELKKAEVKGIGEDEMLYPNTLPEGRFYCRTVRIIIETPVDEK